MMRVTDGDGQRIRRVGLGVDAGQQDSNHHRDLRLVGMAGADY